MQNMCKLQMELFQDNFSASHQRALVGRYHDAGLCWFVRVSGAEAALVRIGTALSWRERCSILIAVAVPRQQTSVVTLMGAPSSICCRFCFLSSCSFNKSMNHESYPSPAVDNNVEDDSMVLERFAEIIYFIDVVSAYSAGS